MRLERHCASVIFVLFACWSSSHSSEENQLRRHGHQYPDSRWDVWSAWSECSVDCGTGIVKRSRDCRSMANGEMVDGCVGLNEEIKVCEITGCIKEVTTTSKCKKLQSRMYGGKRYHWQPYPHPTKPCELACRPIGAGFFLGLGQNVSDGVACNKNGSQVCIRGQCLSLGCDGIVGSVSAIDKCGVCAGDGTTCKTIQNVFTDSKKTGYQIITTIPKGATNIIFTEVEKSRNYLVIKSSDGSFNINTMFRLSRFGERPGAGTVFTYNRGTGPDCPDECIHAEGPLESSVQLMALMYVDNKGIKYSYNVPKDTITYDDTEEDEQSMVYIEGGSIPRWNKGVDTTVYKRPIFSYDFKFKTNKKHHKHHIHSAEINLHKDDGDDDNDDNIPESHDNISGDVTGKTGALSKGDIVNREFEANNQNESDIVSDTDTGDDIQLHAGDNKDTGNYTDTVVVAKNDTGETIDTDSEEKVETTTATVVKTTDSYIEIEDVPAKKDSDHPGITEHDYGDVEGDVSESEEQQQANIETEATQVDHGDEHTDDNISLEVDEVGVESTNDTDADNIQEFVKDEDSDENTDTNVEKETVSEAVSNNATETAETDTQIGNTVDTGAGAVVNADMYNNDNRIPSLYSWREVGYTQCSETCDQGKQTPIVECIVTDKQARVEDKYCSDLAKPQSVVLVCNYGPCPPSWQPQTWSKCSVTCDIGTQVRDYVCVRSDGIEVNNYECGSSSPRREERACDMGSCTSGWYFTEWPTDGKCPATCGYGVISRHVRCFSDSGNVHTACPEREKPTTEKSCRDDQCGGFWLTGPWSACNATCGMAYQTRDVACAQKQRSRILVVSESACGDEERPPTYMSCDLEDCRPEWYMNDWSQCSATCESGQKSRDVRCLDHTQQPSSGCDSNTKPTDRESCTVNRPCPVADQSEPKSKPSEPERERPRPLQNKPDPLPSNCKDKFAQCVLVLRAKLCQYKYYAKICCKSCSLVKKT